MTSSKENGERKRRSKKKEKKNQNKNKIHRIPGSSTMIGKYLFTFLSGKCFSSIHFEWMWFPNEQQYEI